MPDPIRVAVLRDFLQEEWPSMDIVGEAIVKSLQDGHADEVQATAIVPKFRFRLSRLPFAAKRFSGPAFNVDRLINRFVDYPAQLSRPVRRRSFDLFHLVDHSYAQLVHDLPPNRTVVTCHDLDTFRCLFEPDREPRPAWFRAMTRRTLEGLKKAAMIACVSQTTHNALQESGLFDARRLRVVPNGIAETYSPDDDPEATEEIIGLIGPKHAETVELLHVGTNIARKRIDVLLNVFAEIRRRRPEARLIKVGGAFQGEHARQVETLGIGDAIVATKRLETRELAAIYRRADLVLVPSEAEGFGLPLAEALACGATVLASDIPVLREVGGSAVVYRPVGDVPAWTRTALELLDDRRLRNDSFRLRRQAGLSQAARFQWSAHAAKLVEIYRRVLGR